MSYAKGYCRNEFTAGQISRVLQTLNNAGNRCGAYAVMRSAAPA
jgi:hypothetical protein